MIPVNIQEVAVSGAGPVTHNVRHHGAFRRVGYMVWDNVLNPAEPQPMRLLDQGFECFLSAKFFADSVMSVVSYPCLLPRLACMMGEA